MWFKNRISSENFSPHTAQLAIRGVRYRHLFRLSTSIIYMQKNTKLPKLSFSITPDPYGYLIACNEMPYLFTDARRIEEINEKICQLVSEYIEYFPSDAAKRGVGNGIPTEVVWKATPNSVALD